MKKLYCLLIALVLFPVISFSDSDEGLFIGTWIHTEYLNSGTLQFIIIDLKDDHSSVTVFGKADGDDSKVPGRSFISTWEKTSKGVHVITGHNSTKDLQYENGCLYEKYSGMKDVYFRVSSSPDHSDDPVPVSSSQPFNDPAFDQKLSEGVLLPAGDYIVGVDIPSGDYRADVVSDVGGIIRVYRTKAEAEKSSLSYINEINLGNMWGTLVFRLTLEDGNYIQLKYNSLKLYPYAGLLDLSMPRE